MVIEALDKNVISQIRSSCAINSVTQCVLELIFNSLDAKATSIGIRVNLSNFRIQVIDNGRGISRNNLEFVGLQYMSSRCHTLSDLKKRLKFYGFKGEALFSIAKISARLNVSSRENGSDETFSKIIEDNDSQIISVVLRPSFGTTVTVDGFLARLPVRQQCVKSNELDKIKKQLENLIILHPGVSFTVRNDSTGKILLDSQKCVDVRTAFKRVHPSINYNNFVLLKSSKSRTCVEGLINKDFADNKKLQYFFVNKRPVNCTKLQSFIYTLFKKLGVKELNKKHPIFVIHIKCPYSELDLNLEPSKTEVYFKKVEIVIRCLEKVFRAFLGKQKSLHNEELPRKDNKSDFGVSQIGGAIKRLGIKRKSEDDIIDCSNEKSQKITQEIPVDNLEEINNSLESFNFKIPDIEEEINNKPLIPKKCGSKKEIEPMVLVESEVDELKNNDGIDQNSSLFTYFPENEKKGKDVIMDLFIQSVKVYPSQNDESTINYLKRPPIFAPDAFSMRSPSLQSISKEHQEAKTIDKPGLVKKGMVCIGIQTDDKEIEKMTINKITYMKDDFINATQEVLKSDSLNNNSDDIAILSEGFHFEPEFKNQAQNFQRQFYKPHNNLFDLRDLPSNKGIFRTLDNNLFDSFLPKKKPIVTVCPKLDKINFTSKIPLTKNIHKNKTSFNKPVQESPYFVKKIKPRNDLLLQTNSNESVKKQFEFNPSQSIEDHSFRKPHEVFGIFGENVKLNEAQNEMQTSRFAETEKLEFNVSQSPGDNEKHIASFDETSVSSESCMLTKYYEKDDTDQNTMWKMFLKQENIEEFEMTPYRPKRGQTSYHNETISKYFTPCVNKIESDNKKYNKNLPPESQDLFLLPTLSQQVQNEDNNRSEDSQSRIVVTISEEDRKRVMRKNLKFDKEIFRGKKVNFVTQTLTNTNDWVKETTNFGTALYVNQKTGVRTFNSPKNDINFSLANRYECVPKGLSPILKDVTGKVDPLSPKTKAIFQTEVVKCYEDDLLLVKWQNYIGDNKDPKKFFDEMYLENSKMFEAQIPNVNKSGLSKHCAHIFEGMSFTKKLFENIEVIGQIDLKFIASVERSKNLLILFDQHAVHERVRLEMLNEAYKNASVSLDQTITIFLPQENLALIKNQELILQSVGLIFEGFKDGIVIKKIPLCIYNKSKKGTDLVLLVKTLLNEIVEMLKNNRGLLINTPKVIQNIVNSEACRGAIKFGDPLSKVECFVHLKDLAKCDLPFQCAHGRPTLTPLIVLSNTIHLNDFEHYAKPDLQKLHIG